MEFTQYPDPYWYILHASPVCEALFSLLCKWQILSRTWKSRGNQQIQLIFSTVVFIKDQLGQCDDFPGLIVNCLFATSCQGAPQTLTNNSKNLFQSLRRGGDDM